MSKPTLKNAYETAFAVFSPRVQFVEWKMYKVPSVDPRTWAPYYEYTGELLWDTWQEIKGKRWIYAFRSQMDAARLKQSGSRKFDPTARKQPGTATLVDEFFLDEKKQLHATQMDKLWAQEQASKRGWPERGKSGTKGDRGAQVPIGTTVSFIRQFLGKPYVYYFFAARAQLRSSLIDELQKNIVDWVPAITFEPNDPYIYQGPQGEELRVPVLDPITIATYLHQYYIAASDDLNKYLTPVDDSHDPHSDEKKKKTKERQKKFLLAQIVNSIIDANPTLRGIDDRDRLDSFLHGYQDQVQFRKEWRNRWGTYLAYWLCADPILLLAKAHQFDEVAEFPDFLLQMAHCHFRLSESPQGRDLLKAHFTHPEKFPWVHKYAFGRGITTDQIQAARRIPLAVLEFLKEHAPFASLAVGKLSSRDLMKEALHTLFGAEAKPINIIFGKEDRGWLARVKDSKGASELKFIEHEEIELVQVEIAIEHNPRPLKAPWKGAASSLIEGIELINFALAISHFQKTADAEPKEKIIAFLELTEAGLHLTNATLEIFGKGSKKTLATLSFASAAIDAAVGAVETVESLSEAKFGQALGGGIITMGSMMMAVGAFLEGSALGPFGMAMTGVGHALKEYFRDPTDYENFVNFCSFGLRKKVDDLPGGHHKYEADGKPRWYETKKTFAEWADDYDEQIRAAVFLLCSFTIEPEAIPVLDDYRAGRHHLKGSSPSDIEDRLLRGNITMGWIPRGAKLHLKMVEDWVDRQDFRAFTAEVEFGDEEQPKVVSTTLKVTSESGGKELVVQGPRRAASEKPIFEVSDFAFLGVNENLNKITLTGSLEVKIGEGTFFAKPVEDGVLYKPQRGSRQSDE